MKIAVDTNVLVRYLVWDDKTQATKAVALIEGSDTIVISLIVLCELVWVLKRAYRYTNNEIGDAVHRLTTSRRVEVDQPAAQAGLVMLARGGDFADGVIEYESHRANCHRLVTFDQTFAGLLDRSRGA